MKLKLFALFFIIGAIVFVYSQAAENRFAQAEDFPRDALVYVQFADLPAAVRLWNESQLRRDYLQSENFKQFQNRHLALKLAERFTEFNNALGFPIDAEIFANVSETKAALAVYDIGKMEAVFIAPISEAVFSASLIFQKRGDYEEITLEDGTIYYRREIEIDGARQRQKFAFANIEGRFIFASDEKLLLRTIAVISGKSAKNRLSDEPDFAKLAAKITPHQATVWINQARLSDDYYFKRYWLMQNRDELKKFRAGIFDFEMRDEKWIERRQFVMAKSAENANAKISANQAENLRAMLPENFPFYKIETLENQPQKSAELLQKTLFDRVQTTAKTYERTYNWRYFDEAEFYGARANSDYYYSNSDFGEEIDDGGDDAPETEQNAADANFEVNLTNLIASAAPQFVLSATDPQLLPAPQFAEFRRVLIFRLRSPKNFARANLENALAANLTKQITVGDAQTTQLNWETREENEQTWRELNLPMLGRGIFYALQNDKLIFSNSRNLLIEILAGANKTAEKDAENEWAFDDLTVVRLDKRADAFDRIMQRIAAEESASTASAKDFFTGNIGSLLDATAQVARIEIKRNQTKEFLTEEISFALK